MNWGRLCKVTSDLWFGCSSSSLCSDYTELIHSVCFLRTDHHVFVSFFFLKRSLELNLKMHLFLFRLLLFSHSEDIFPKTGRIWKHCLDFSVSEWKPIICQMLCDNKLMFSSPAVSLVSELIYSLMSLSDNGNRKICEWEEKFWLWVN